MSRPNKLPKVLTDRETDRFLSTFNRRYRTPHRDEILVRLMLYAGLRCGESVAVRPEHIDMQTCRLQVREGKGAKDRVVWIPDNLRDLIGSWLSRRTDSPWLLPTSKGTRVATRQVRAMVSRRAEKANLAEAERVSPHTFRHTFATRLLKKTGNIRLVQKALGHSDVSTTMVYTHLTDSDLEEAMRGPVRDQEAA